MMSSSSVAQNILALSLQYSYYAYLTIFIVGIIGNVLNILVFTQLKIFRDNRCAFYLVIESIVDIVYLVAFFTSSILSSICGSDPAGYSLVWCRLRSILVQTSALTSFFIVCYAACDQFCSTCYRFNLRQICTLEMARRLTIIASCILFLHSILFGFFLDIKPSVGCVISNSIWTRYSTFFFYPVLYGLLPIVVSSSFSFLAFRNVRHIVRRQVPIVRRRLDRQMTALVLTRVIFFVFASLPYTTYRIYAINNTSTPADRLKYAIELLIYAICISIFELNFAV